MLAGWLGVFYSGLCNSFSLETFTPLPSSLGDCLSLTLDCVFFGTFIPKGLFLLSIGTGKQFSRIRLQYWQVEGPCVGRILSQLEDLVLDLDRKDRFVIWMLRDGRKVVLFDIY